MSGFDTTPPRPVPATAAMSTPRSSAIRRAAGDDLVLPLCDCAGTDDEVAPAVRVAGGAGAGGEAEALAAVDAAAAGADALAPAVAGTAVSSSSPSTSST